MPSLRKLILRRRDPTANAVRQVQKSASDFGGTCTQRFSQCTDPVASIINMLPSTANGICLMLSASWVGNLANGKSLWDQVYFGGHFNAASIVTLMHNFIDDEVQNINWAVVREEYMKQHGVTHVRTPDVLGDSDTASAAVGGYLADAINGGPGAFVTMDMNGPGGAHAVAAWNAIGAYVFFDPNYGEFRFANLQQLRGFLRNMVVMSGYDAMFGDVCSDIWRRS